MSEAGKVPVRESVGMALRFLGDNVRFVGMAAAIASAVLTALTLLTLYVGQGLGVLFGIAGTFISAGAYAAFLTAALRPARPVATNQLGGDAWRVWASMAVVGFFLFIIFVVALIPGFFMLGAALAPYSAEFQAAQQDQAALAALAQRVLSERPGPFLFFMLFYGVAWLALTSRLYLAAPATLDQNRVMAFETWSWTKGAMLRICAARIMLLFPAYVLVQAVEWLLGMALGVDLASPAHITSFAAANPALFTVLAFVRNFIFLGLYSALEAGLSAYLYKGLKPEPETSVPPAP